MTAVVLKEGLSAKVVMFSSCFDMRKKKKWVSVEFCEGAFFSKDLKSESSWRCTPGIHLVLCRWGWVGRSEGGEEEEPFCRAMRILKTWK